MKKPIDLTLIGLVIVFLLVMCGCNKPFMVGKKHQLRFGTPKKTKEIVRVIATAIGNNDKISVLFIRNNKDTFLLDNLTQADFDGIFKPVNK